MTPRKRTIKTANHILIVEDEQAIRRFVRMALETEGYRVFEAETQQRGLIDAGTRKPDMIILDLGLPDGDGMDFIRDVRAWSSTPIIVLSARVEEFDKVAALDAGADDYLGKPFGVSELLARVRAALRRGIKTTDNDASRVAFGDIVIDLVKRQVSKSGATVRLTPVEFRLMSALVQQVGRVLTHRHLLREVWGPAHVEHNHYLRIYMGHLRHKLEDDPARPQYFLTETGIGYRFTGAC